MMRRSRRTLLATLVTGLALVAGPVTMAVAQTTGEASTEVGFFEATADAAGVGVSFGNPGSQPNPVAAGLVPNATAELGAGPSGRALSSMMWPGPLAANAGTLAALVGVPLPPEVLTNANYPVKAEARSSGGGRDEQTVGPMSAVVDGEESTARTALSDFDSPGIVSAARVVTTSRSFLEGGSVVSVAETQLQGVEIAGLITIDNIKTMAKATSDGVQATTEQAVTLTGVAVQGQGASIDQDGLHFGTEKAESPLTPVTGGLNQVIAAMGMEAFVTTPVEQQSSGGAGAVRSGSVVFHWNLGDGGDYLTVVLGGASAVVGATPGSSFDLGGDLGGDLGSFGPSGDTGSFSDPGPAPATDFGTVDAGAVPSGGSGGSGGGGGSEIVEPIGFTDVSAVSDRVPLGWMLIGLLGMALVGSSLHGLRVSAIGAAMAGTTCPLERGAT